MRDNPKAGEVYRHFKGNNYEVISIATGSEDGESQVVYKALYPPYTVYVRPLEMFMELSGIFFKNWPWRNPSPS